MMKRKIIALLSVLILAMTIFALPVYAAKTDTTKTDTATSATDAAGTDSTDTAATKPKGGLMALSFDDGPSKNTIKLLDELKKRKIHATFFIVGERVEEFSDVLVREYKEGHEIGTHTWNHLNLANTDGTTANENLQRTEDAINAAIGTDLGPLPIRPPYGSVNDNTRSYVNAPLILWSIDTLDWKSRNAEAVKEKIINQAHDGAIILLHDLYDTSVDGCIAAIDELTKEGYTFVTVSELFRRKGQTLETGVTYTNAEDNGVDLGPLPEKDKKADKEKEKKEPKKEKERVDKGFPWKWLIFCIGVLAVYTVGMLRAFGLIQTVSPLRKDDFHEKTTTHPHRNAAHHSNRRHTADSRRNPNRRNQP